MLSLPWDSLQGIITFTYSYLIFGFGLGFKNKNALFFSSLTALLHEFTINFCLVVNKYTIPKDIIKKSDQLNTQLFIVYGFIILWTILLQYRHSESEKNISDSLCREAFLTVIGVCISSILVLSHILNRELNDILFVVLDMFELSCYVYLLTKKEIEQKIAIKNELEFNKKIYELKKQQFNISAYNQNELNQKCHDLKYYVSCLANHNQGEVIEQLTKVIDGFDNIIKTGNSTLDILLTDQLNLAKQYSIDFHIIADGKLLEKIEDIDLYVLIGNIMDNAIEYLRNAGDSVSKNITLNIYRKNNFIVIKEENPCDQPRPFVDGLPTSSKNAPVNHGYGLKSIAAIIKKYNGNMSVQFHEGLYSLTILIPFI